MALAILDGTQTATTLSTILSSGQHITAHTVVSLGTQAITDILNATSAGLTNTQLRASAVTIGGTVTVGNSVTISSLPAISGAVTANVGNITSLVGGGYSAFTDLLANETIAVRELPAISGTVTANLNLPSFAGSDGDNLTSAVQIGYYDNNYGEFRAVNSLTSQLPVTVTNLVEASLRSDTTLPAGTNRIGVVTIGAGTVTIGAGTSQIGSVTASISNSVTIASLPAISGTVTANSSNGSLTTRFGSVTTANTAFATSAVTNANRKYLLIQNVTTASNVITVGIGFTPTTTQGIQLSSGAGLTFEGSYIPTGAVNLLSSVTASCFTILEA